MLSGGPPALYGSRQVAKGSADEHRMVFGGPPAALDGLRKAGQQAVADALARGGAADAQALFALYRRYPWATQVHRAMVDWAEPARRHRPGLPRVQRRGEV